jgi:antitoxin component of MazEF toxin-antitoxin module
MSVRFSAELAATGGNTTGIPVPPEIIDQLGGGKRPAVKVTIGSYTYATTIGVMKGQTLIPVSADRRKQAGIAAGDHIEVEVERDAERAP